MDILSNLKIKTPDPLIKLGGDNTGLVEQTLKLPVSDNATTNDNLSLAAYDPWSSEIKFGKLEKLPGSFHIKHYTYPENVSDNISISADYASFGVTRGVFNISRYGVDIYNNSSAPMYSSCFEGAPRTMFSILENAFSSNITSIGCSGCSTTRTNSFAFYQSISIDRDGRENITEFQYVLPKSTIRGNTFSDDADRYNRGTIDSYITTLATRDDISDAVFESVNCSISEFKKVIENDQGLEVKKLNFTNNFGSIPYASIVSDGDIFKFSACNGNFSISYDDSKTYNTSYTNGIWTGKALKLIINGNNNNEYHFRTGLGKGQAVATLSEINLARAFTSESVHNLLTGQSKFSEISMASNAAGDIVADGTIRMSVNNPLNITFTEFSSPDGPGISFEQNNQYSQYRFPIINSAVPRTVATTNDIDTAISKLAKKPEYQILTFASAIESKISNDQKTYKFKLVGSDTSATMNSLNIDYGWPNIMITIPKTNAYGTFDTQISADISYANQNSLNKNYIYITVDKDIDISNAKIHITNLHFNYIYGSTLI